MGCFWIHFVIQEILAKSELSSGDGRLFQRGERSESCVAPEVQGILSIFSDHGAFLVYLQYPDFFQVHFLKRPKLLAQDESDEDDDKLDISVAGLTLRLQDSGRMLMVRVSNKNEAGYWGDHSA